MDKKTKCTAFEYDVNEIIEGLWLGNFKAAYNEKFLRDYNIKHVLTIMDNFDINKKINGVNYMVIPLKDIQICQFDPIVFFEKTNNFIQNGLSKGEGVLVHCKKGHHRSASAVVAFIIANYRIDYENTIKYINKLRPCSLKRETCMTKGLFQFYKHINNLTCDNHICTNKNGYFACYCRP